MSVIQLTLNGHALDLTDDKFSESFSAVDSISTSEAGTTLRAVTRAGIPTLSVSYKCLETEKALLDEMSRASSLIASRWSEESAATVQWVCYMNGYSADLITERGSHRYYKVSFKLNDLEN